MKRISIVIATLVTTSALPLHGEDKIQKVIEEGLVTRTYLDTLTHDDVPEKWCERVEEEKKDKYFLRTYFRGNRKALIIMWTKDWTGEKAKMFVATIYDGDTQISKIAHIGDSVTIFPVDSEDGYEQTVSLKDDGTVMVAITHDNGYFEGIEVKGRESNLMDDLEYTKAMISMKNIVKPLLESITEQLNAPPKKRSKPRSDTDETTKTEDGTEQSAAAEKSKPEVDKNPNPKSEERPQ